MNTNFPFDNISDNNTGYPTPDSSIYFLLRKYLKMKEYERRHVTLEQAFTQLIQI